MSRWWDDPDVASDVLGLVDDSDVVQGVGTAFLGYHALAAAPLRELADGTLVDLAQVSQALAGVDVAPVAVALSKALAPSLGASADVYGQMLAQSLHERAVQSTSTMLSSWTSGGLAWPAALTRAAGVHGADTSDLGTYGETLKAVALAEPTRADVSDRVLMKAAERIAVFEASGPGVEPVRKDQLFERLHPRDDDGQFGVKQATPVAAVEQREGRKERLDRKARRSRIRSRQEQTVARSRTRAAEKVKPEVAQVAPQTAKRTVVAEALANYAQQERRVSALDAAAQGITQQSQKVREEKRKTLREGLNAAGGGSADADDDVDDEYPAFIKAVPENPYAGELSRKAYQGTLDTHVMNDDVSRYALFVYDDSDVVVSAAGRSKILNVKNLESTSPGATVPLNTAFEVSNIIDDVTADAESNYHAKMDRDYSNHDDLSNALEFATSNMCIVEFTEHVLVSDDTDLDGKSVPFLSNKGRYYVEYRSAPAHIFSVMFDDEDGISHSLPVQMFTAHLINSDGRVHSSGVSKDYLFEREHPRDDDGQFSVQQEAVRDRRERLERKARRGRIKARQSAAAQSRRAAVKPVAAEQPRNDLAGRVDAVLAAPTQDARRQVSPLDAAAEGIKDRAKHNAERIQNQKLTRVPSAYHHDPYTILAADAVLVDNSEMNMLIPRRFLGEDRDGPAPKETNDSVKIAREKVLYAAASIGSTLNILERKTGILYGRPKQIYPSFDDGGAPTIGGNADNALRNAERNARIVPLDDVTEYNMLMGDKMAMKLIASGRPDLVDVVELDAYNSVELRSLDGFRSVVPPVHGQKSSPVRAYWLTVR